MEIFGLLAFIFLSKHILKESERKDYSRFLDNWRINACSKNQHFVIHGDGYCDVCGEHAIMLKNGGWKWHKKV